MSGSTFTFGVQLTEISCGECGGTYAINERYREQKYEKSGYWNCPYCKVQWGYGESENDKLKRQRHMAGKHPDWAPDVEAEKVEV